MADLERLDGARVLTAMITPFNEQGTINHDGAQKLAAYLVEHGSDGLVLAGTTGESPSLLADDQIDLFDTVREAVGEEVPLIGGTGSNSTAEAIHMSREAAERGSVDALLVVGPYYNKPPQYGIARHYERIGAVAEELPVILYNIPGRTGRLIEQDTITELVDKGFVSGLKDATGETNMAAALHEEFQDDLLIYSGDDGRNLEFAKAGAVGAISVASHWAGREMGEMFDAFFAGDIALAERIQEALQPSAAFESSDETPNPIPTKAMMRRILGAETIGECLPPMEASPEAMEALHARSATVLNELAKAMYELRNH